jgi:hypothetical protein
MIRTIFFLVLASMLGSDAFCQQRHLGRIDGEPVSIVLSVDQLGRAPSWSSDDDGEPPLSVGKAIKAAKLAVVKEYPNLKDKDWTVSVALEEETSSINTGDHFTDSDGIEYYCDDVELTIVLDRWVYWVRLTWQPVVGNGITAHFSPNIPVAILMDGTAVLPSKITKPTPEPEFRVRYRKLRKD